MRIETFAAAIVLSAFAQAAETDIPRLDGSRIPGAQADAAVNRLLAAAEVTGAAIGILHQGRVVYLHAYGFRDRERKLPLTVDSVLTAASLTKSAFAYLAMQLVDSHLLDLDKPVEAYLPKPLPEYPGYEGLAGDARYRKLTARMLLDHTSGFANLRWLEPDRKLKIHFEPGSRYAYSGEGILLLQLVVETVTHKPLDELMRERVFQPLGMTRTGMVTAPRFLNDIANGYDEYGRSLGHQNRKEANAAGSMQTTVRDFTTFLQAMLEGKGISPAAREQMLSPQIRIHSLHQFPSLDTATTAANDAIRLSYGLGWGLYWSPYGEVFFKEGHDEGFRNYAAAFDGPKDGIVIMTNSSNGEGIFQELLETLLRDTFTPIEWEGYTPYQKLPRREPLPVHRRVTVEAAALDRLVGRYSLSPELVLTVTRRGDHLAMQENNEDAQEMFPESPTRFFSTVSDDVVTFDLDSSGQAVRLTVHTGGRDIPVNRAR